MIFSTEITYSVPCLKDNISALGVKLHGAVMGLIPSGFADELHKNSVQPFSMYCLYDEKSEKAIVRVYALSDKARIINNALSDTDEIKIYGISSPIKKINSVSREIDINEEADKIKDKVRLNILTPAIYRSGGRSFCTPELTRFFRSTAEKFTLFTGEGDTDYLCGLISKIHLTDYSLSGKSYNISGNIYNGMTGFVDIPITKKDADKEFFKKLLVFSQYSGIGAKTAMGMGGVKIEII